MNTWYALQTYCATVKEGCIERPQLKALFHKIEVARQNADKAFQLLGYKIMNNRNKRHAWFSAIGKGFHFLFGTLNEDNEDELKSLIQKGRNDTSTMAGLLANQTEIIYTELGAAHERAKKLEEITEELRKARSEEIKRTDFLSGIEELEANTLQYEIDIQTVTNAILFATKGVLHPQFFDVNTINASANLAKEIVRTATFPGVNMTELEISKIAEITIIGAGTGLIYCLNIPLVNKPQYQTYKASPLPIKQTELNITGAFAYIWPASQYFVVDEQKEYYIQLSGGLEHECRKFRGSYICRNPGPSHRILDDSPCEIKLAVGMKIRVVLACNIKLAKLKHTFWARATLPNSWIYSVVKEEQISTSCEELGNAVYDIKGIGLLHLPAGCTAHTSTIKLTTNRTVKLNYTIFQFQKTKLDLNELIKAYTPEHAPQVRELLNSTGILDMPLHRGTDFGILKAGVDLHKIIDKARELGKYSSLAGEVVFFTHTVTASSATSIIIIIIVLVAVIWKVKNKGGHPTTNPTGIVSDTLSTQSVVTPAVALQPLMMPPQPYIGLRTSTSRLNLAD